MIFNQGASLNEVLFQGFAPDGTLYLPQDLPHFDVKHFRDLSFLEICSEMGKELFPEIEEFTFNPPLPFLPFSENMYVLELFHGPTFSFKDFGAQILAQLVRAFKEDDEELTVLVATSGDTGSAIGHAFYDIPGIRVCILFPKGRVTPSQEKQLTSLGNNVTVVEIDGSFEQCQELVKRACLDPDLPNVTIGNSINVARLLAHTFTYFYAYSRLPDQSKSVYFSVPSGNFGHLVAGMLAKKMGLPVARFIGATNINAVVPEYLRTGVFEPRTSRPTMAVSMDVGNPSNFPRLLELYHHDLNQLRADLVGFSFQDDEIARAIRDVYETKGYLLDPHSAIGYLGLKKFMESKKDQLPGIFFATAHPGKFRESLEPLIHESISLPQTLQQTKFKQVLFCSSNYKEFVSILITI